MARLLILLALSFGILNFALAASKPVSEKQIEKAISFLADSTGWKFNSAQKVEFDPKLWSRETFPEGVEIFTSLKKIEQKRAVLRDGVNLSSISTYELKGTGVSATENSTSAVFDNGILAALTQCHDDGDKEGRSCVTVTHDVCAFIEGSGGTIPNNVTEQLKVLEIRALATILTLRGNEHQLENVSRFGSRLGLKNPLQTTRGKLGSSDKRVQNRLHTEAKPLCTALQSAASV